MRYTALLLLITIVMSFLTGKAFYTMTGSLDSITLDKEDLSKAMKGIDAELQPDMVYDFNDLFATPELFSSSSFFNDLVLQGSQLSQVSFASTSSCKFRYYPILLGFQAKQKYDLWFDYLCGDIKKLPEGFFAQPPFLHPCGKSYTWLALQTRSNIFEDTWITDHLRYFKLDEFSFLPNADFLPTPYNIFAHLTSEQKIFFLQQRSYFIVRDFLVLQPKKTLGSMFQQLWGNVENFSVRFYSLDKVNKYLAKTPYLISLRKKHNKCLIKQNNVCWHYSLRYYFSYASSTTIFVLILSLILLGVVVIIFWQKMREERRHEGNQRLALQILSHEFRTPISSLVLQNELLSKFRSKFPSEAEEHLMEISANIFRLQRLAEMSKNYLLASRHGKFNLQKKMIDNIEDIMLSILDEFCEFDIHYEQSKKIKVFLDPFWLQIAVKNLLSNAIKYGEEPILVKVRAERRNLIIAVIDQGKGPVESLKQLTGEFKRGGDNNGMGLGLNIVKRAMEGVGGELTLHTNPTTFTLHFYKVVENE